MKIGELAQKSGVHVETIRYYQGLGFSLGEVRRLLDLSAGEHCAQTRTFAEEKKRLVDQKVADLRAIQAALDKLIRACGRGSGGRGCPITESLSASTAAGR